MVITTQERLAALERQVARIQRKMLLLNARSNQYKLAQLMIFVAGILVVSFSLAIARWLGLLIALAGIIAFVMLARAARKIDKSFLKHKFWLQTARTQAARVRLDWQAMPRVPALEKEVDHPFDNDLDVSGERSLHQLINTAVSFEGMQTLLDWLLCRVPDLDAVRKRQALVQELVPLTRFRNKLMLHAALATRFSSEALDGERLVNWLEDERNAPPVPTSTLLISIALWVLTILFVVLYIFVHISPLFCIGTWLLSIVWFLAKKHEQGDLTNDASFINFAFMQLSPIFEYLEKYPYRKHSQLRALCEPFFMHGDRRPSIVLKKLERITKRASLGSNAEAWFALNALAPIGVYTAYQLHQNKSIIADYLPAWLDIWYELEALSSLANFAYLNPEYTVPQIVAGKKQDKSVVFAAQRLGHPLIPSEQKVANDFHISDQGEVEMITGSNMAGKSTFLRTIGANLCLAFAGSVVDASLLQTSLFELYACIKVTDSLADGYSYFYAEVRRLKGLLTELEQGTQFPLFFLVDEIFKGTNNYERLIGSEAYIRALVGKRCVGAISTHDLELVKLADTFPEIKNYHFREDVVDGKMVFDYTLRPGPSPTRNALKIMQMEGLPVKWDSTPQSALS